ncbi:MAG: TRAP transporter substrate-binding protein [bacterium]
MKKFLSILLVLAMVALFIPALAEVTPELTLTIASNATDPTNPYSYGLDKFKEVAEEVSGGKIAVVVHKGTLGENESELVEKLTMGAADMVVSSPGFMTGIGVAEVDFLSLEYLFDSFEHWEKCMDGEFGDNMRELIKEKTFNMYRIMGYWSSSVRDVYAKKAIKSPEDLKGLSIRTQSSQVQQNFFKACGAVPTSVAWGELYQALQQGVVDGAENDYTNLTLKEHHRTPNGKFISETHHDYTTRLFLMDGTRYDRLTDEQKAWIDEASAAATAEERAITYRMFEESKQKAIDAGAEITEHADIDIAAFKAIAAPIQDEFAAKNNMTAQLEMIRAAAE